MFEDPTKVFPCDCMGEGIAVNKEHSSEDLAEGEVAVGELRGINDKFDMRDCEESPYIRLSFWEFGHHRHGKWTLWQRLKMAYEIAFKNKGSWEDMVCMKADHAKNFANHILYLITKGEREKKLGEPIVKDSDCEIITGSNVSWPENEIMREDQETGPGGKLEPRVKDQASLVREAGRNCSSSHENEVSDRLDAAVGVEPAYPYFCVQHGGSAACEESNMKHGFTCPRCDQDAIVEGIKDGSIE